MQNKVSWLKRLSALVPVTCLALGLGFTACGTDDKAAVASKVDPGTVNPEGGACETDENCELGTVCTISKKCAAVPCFQNGSKLCVPGQICYTNPTSGDETCSRPECANDQGCEGTKTCDKGLCVDDSCTSKEDCKPDKICNLLAKVCVPPPASCASDLDCVSGKKCNKSTSACVDEGSAPSCTKDVECEDNQYCDTDVSECKEGCRNGDSCAADQNCSGDRKCVCDATKCSAGESCNAETQRCANLCDGVTCDAPNVCDAKTGMCIDPGNTTCVQVPSLCNAMEICNSQTGKCDPLTMMCANGKSQATCDGTDNPVFDPMLCECVECLSETNCNQGAGEICNAGRCIAQCATKCDPQTSGTCMGDTPYCFGTCCVQCVGPGDCDVANGEICVDNFCGQAPTCTPGANPSECPSGNVCNNGKCEPAAAGGECNADGSKPCPMGQFCEADPANPMSTVGTCKNLGGNPGGPGGPGLPGGGACGTCKDDCTCEKGLTCTNGSCVGCQGKIKIGPVEFDADIGVDDTCVRADGSGGNLCLNGTCAGFDSPI